MSVESESDQPNEFGFAGGATAPQPRTDESTSAPDGEGVAVPAGDLTGAVSDAVEDMSHGDDAQEGDTEITTG
jgi:hypothetical protein